MAVFVSLLCNPFAILAAASFLSEMKQTILMRTIYSGSHYPGQVTSDGLGWLFAVRYPVGLGAGIGFAAWMLVGTVRSGIRRTRMDMVILSWLIPYLALVTLIPVKFMR
ncbi:MAG: hypothetical protein NVSMB52_20650 [Chloroflexota bacterium]